MTRIDEGVTRPEASTIEVDGAAVSAYVGESLAAALLAAGQRAFRVTDSGVRGPFCNMGICFECVVEVDGVRVRACMTTVRAGMTVRTGVGGTD
jgi:predicted molibdopterin-dependent oxidoreductase YjgC